MLFLSDLCSQIITSYCLRLFNKTEIGTLCKSNLWHLEIIVTGIFLTSVVAKINFKCRGGSSRVFKSPLKACFDSI